MRLKSAFGAGWCAVAMLISVALATALSGGTPTLPRFVRFERTFSPIFIKESVSVTLVTAGSAATASRYRIRYERRDLSNKMTTALLDSGRCPGILKIIPELQKVQPPSSGALTPPASDGTTYSLEASTPFTNGQLMTSSDPRSPLVTRVKSAFAALNLCLPGKGIQ